MKSSPYSRILEADRLISCLCKIGYKLTSIAKAIHIHKSRLSHIITEAKDLRDNPESKVIEYAGATLVQRLACLLRDTLGKRYPVVVLDACHNRDSSVFDEPVRERVGLDISERIAFGVRGTPLPDGLSAVLASYGPPEQGLFIVLVDTTDGREPLVAHELIHIAQRLHAKCTTSHSDDRHPWAF